MNNARRKALVELASRIEGFQLEIQTLLEKVEPLLDEVTQHREDEQEYFNAMPNALQGSDKGQAAEAAVEKLDEVIDAFEGLKGILEEFDTGEIVSAISEAAA